MAVRHYPDVRHSECPNVHLGRAASCRDCRRLYERDWANEAGSSDAVQQISSEVAAVEVASEAVAEKAPPEKVLKEERLEVARRAMTNAEKCKAYRERLGDEYRRRNAARMARKRKG